MEFTEWFTKINKGIIKETIKKIPEHELMEIMLCHPDPVDASRAIITHYGV